ncbi:hypothetical protein SAMN02746065_103114 [Desulfocicer vacuolatum DSM 3385]|uniref:Uncharacterized protein n=1 Tax=Desulfocicer vacuolatum DSM 3385 TaxID=1121400 RepID=A0A1W1ZQS3_9BACT|nr:hypothetical protein [Desulfocicer vacuolatum]SMC50890.1 hypothetical protein SAMN02746065_103114 [Desulfocicer vacuolatum DSM 3385]
MDILDLHRSGLTQPAIARRAGTVNARKASAHETNKAFDRYCQYQDDTAFEMARIVKGENSLCGSRNDEKWNPQNQHFGSTFSRG